MSLEVIDLRPRISRLSLENQKHISELLDLLHQNPEFCMGIEKAVTGEMSLSNLWVLVDRRAGQGKFRPKVIDSSQQPKYRIWKFRSCFKFSIPDHGKRVGLFCSTPSSWFYGCFFMQRRLLYSCAPISPSIPAYPLRPNHYTDCENSAAHEYRLNKFT